MTHETPGNPAAIRAMIERALALPVWTAPHDPELLGGGITNVNVKLWDGGKAYVVRLGGDIDAHLVKRFNELACQRAGEAIGLSPRIIHAGDGMLAMEFIDGQVLNETSAATPEMAGRIAAMLRKLHGEGTRAVRGPVLAFWVFHVLRDYAARLAAAGSGHIAGLAELMRAAERLEQAVGPVTLVLGHNDLLPANLIDTGERLWLLDWDYGGFNSPLFDLASIASNCQYSEALNQHLLTCYFEAPSDAARLRGFHAMICASLLRETMWSMVSEITSDIAFDYPAYTEKNRARFAAAWAEFLNS